MFPRIIKIDFLRLKSFIIFIIILNLKLIIVKEMVSATTKKTGGIKDMDRKYFREIFNLHAVDEKINYEGLCKIFSMVDFKPNEK